MTSLIQSQKFQGKKKNSYTHTMVGGREENYKANGPNCKHVMLCKGHTLFLTLFLQIPSKYKIISKFKVTKVCF